MDYETVSSEENISMENAEKENTGDKGNGAQSEAETPEQRKAREEREAKERQLRAKKRRLIPPFVMLSAGAVTSITMRILHYEMKSMLIILLCVLVGFYIAGCIIEGMLNRFERQIEETHMEEGEVIEKELAEEDRATRNSEAIEEDE